MDAAQRPLTDEEFHSACELLRRITPEHELLKLAPTGPAAVYTTLVTLWLLTLQRLGGGMSLAAVVKDVITHSRSLLPDNKRVREGTLSQNSAAYSEARKRLPLAVVEFFANRVCDSLIERLPSWFGNQRAFILDGTTFTLSPTSELTKVFPPATNQFGETVWPVLMMLVAHELQSGCALVPEVGSKFGEDNTSEAKQAAAIAQRLPPRSIVMGDAGFGIFSVCYAMRQAQHDILFRLTQTRYKSLCKKAELVRETGTTRTHQLRWTPSKKDLQSNPHLPADAVLHVTLHEVKLASGESLPLVTTRPCYAEDAANDYARRYDVEHNIRDFKVTMGVERIRARSKDMVLKELMCSVVAYNLVIQFRCEAAKIAKLPPRRLSFTGVWNTFEIMLLRQAPCNSSTWRERYERALQMAAKDKLPNRPGRSHPRKAHPRRAKSTNFMRTVPKKTSKTSDPPDPPPPK